MDKENQPPLPDPRAALDACRVDLACPAPRGAHLTNCPWHPANVNQIVVPGELYDRLLSQDD